PDRGGQPGAVGAVFNYAGFFALVWGRFGGVLCANDVDEYERSNLFDLCYGTSGAGIARDAGKPDQHGFQFWVGFEPDHQRLFADQVRFWTTLPFDYFALYNCDRDVLRLVLAT